MADTGRKTVVLWAALAWLATLGLAWVWGASGRFEAERVARAADHRWHLAEARGDMLEARLSILVSNFGDARAALDRARQQLGVARERYEALRQPEAAAAVGRLVQLVDAAREQASGLDRAAGDTIAEALKGLGELRAGPAGSERPWP